MSESERKIEIFERKIDNFEQKIGIFERKIVILNENQGFLSIKLEFFNEKS